VKEFGIKKLNRTCCVWESTQNFYRDANEQASEISMATEETLLDKRDQWPKIDFFYVTIHRFMDDP